jgi:hypothetical protein
LVCSGGEFQIVFASPRPARPPAWPSPNNVFAGAAFFVKKCTADGVGDFWQRFSDTVNIFRRKMYRRWCWEFPATPFGYGYFAGKANDGGGRAGRAGLNVSDRGALGLLKQPRRYSVVGSFLAPGPVTVFHQRPLNGAQFFVPLPVQTKKCKRPRTFGSTGPEYRRSNGLPVH